MSRIVLSGIISSDDNLEIYAWCGIAAFAPSVLRQAIKDTPNGEILTIELNSPGGDAFAGAEMYAILSDAPCPTQVIVQSYAASAASVFALGGNEVLCAVGAQFMLHLPSCNASGNEMEHEKTLRLLRSTADAMLNIYEAKCKGKASRAELKNIMDAETWLPAQKCIELGLIDGIYAPQASEPKSDIAASFGIPDIGVLRAKFESANQSVPDDLNLPDAGGNDEWKAQAAIEIEKNRFWEEEKK